MIGNKKICDACGKEIPSTVNLPYNAAVGMYSGRFVYGSAYVYEEDDFCRECGAEIRDFIRAFKKSAKIRHHSRSHATNNRGLLQKEKLPLSF